MADDADSILARYGEGYESLASQDSLDYALHGPRPPVTTTEIAGFMPRPSAAQSGLRGLAGGLRGFAKGPEGVPNKAHLIPFLADTGAAAADTAANWLDQRPRAGSDTAAPLGLMAFGSAPMGSLAANAGRWQKRKLTPKEDTAPAQSWTPERKEALKRMHEKGTSYEDIAFELDTTPRSARMAASQFRDELGLGERATGRRPGAQDWPTWTEPQAAEAFARLRNAESITQVAEAMGKTPGDLAGFLQRYQKDPRYGDLASLALDNMLNDVGASFFAKPGKASLPGLLVNAAEQGQKPTAPRYTLGPNRREPDHPWRAQGIIPFNHPIFRDGEKIGSASGYTKGDTASFTWLGATGQENRLGPGGMRALREQFRELYPEVTTFEGIRNSGSRNGPATRRDAGQKQSVKLPADPYASLPGTVVAPSRSEQEDTLATILAPYLWRE